MRLRAIFATNLKALRKAQKLSLEELAHRAGIDRNYPGNLEQQVNSPTLDMVEQIANALGVHHARLLDEEEARRVASQPTSDS